MTKNQTSILKNGKWNAYAVGAAIGVLSWLVFILVDKPLGISTTIAKLGGAILSLFLGRENVIQMAYWEKYTPAVDYGLIFVIAVLIGAFLSSIISGTFAKEKVPKLWARRFGPSFGKRAVAAFIGGILLLFGARMAGGCTSGHGISGTLQLATSSWLFFVAVMAAGVLTAKLLFPKNSLTNS